MHSANASQRWVSLRKESQGYQNAPLLDPIEYEIMGYKISLRRSEAELVEVVTTGMIEQVCPVNLWVR